MYKLLFFSSKALQRDRKKLFKNKQAGIFIEEALAQLILDPFHTSLPVKKLTQPAESTFRLRCGKWRILYDVDTANKNIIIYQIMQRKEGY